MRLPPRIAAYVLLSLAPFAVLAAPTRLLVEERESFCLDLLQALSDGLPPHSFPARVGATVPPGQPVQFRFETPDGRTIDDPAIAWRIDINNNGRPDTVIHLATGYAGGLVSRLLIAEDQDLQVGNRVITASEVASFAKIGAYEDHGLYGPHISPFHLGGTTYLLLYDDWFSPKIQPGRSVVVGKFTGKRLKSQSHWSSSHEIQIICKVQIAQSKKSTSNRRLQGTPKTGAPEPGR